MRPSILPKRESECLRTGEEVSVEFRRPAAVLCGNEPEQIERVFGRGRRDRLAAETRLHPEIIGLENFDRSSQALHEVSVVFSTWGMDQALAARLCALPKLEAFFYAAGSVQGFARPLLDRGVTVISAWAANAVPVAQFTLSQILLSLKGYFRNVREAKRPENRGSILLPDAPGVFGGTVALLGCGMVGKAVVRELRPFGLDVVVYDPFLADAEAARLGVAKVSLEDAFARAFVVSNHLADLPPTRGLLGRALFTSMRQGATFINTGRGATVVEADLARVLGERPDLTALLDVTWPEPTAADSPWYTLENARLSTHIAGSAGDEVARLADYCLEELTAWKEGKPLRYQVTRAMLETMA
jgi:phosphoglycerate dehydrogenase-like enzyme